MNGVDALLDGQGDDAFDVQVGTDGAFLHVELIGFVRFESVHGKPVLLCVDRDRAELQFGRGAEDPRGDFAAIGDEEFADGLDAHDRPHSGVGGPISKDFAIRIGASKRALEAGVSG